MSKVNEKVKCSWFWVSGLNKSMNNGGGVWERIHAEAPSLVGHLGMQSSLSWRNKYGRLQLVIELPEQEREEDKTQNPE